MHTCNGRLLVLIRTLVLLLFVGLAGCATTLPSGQTVTTVITPELVNERLATIVRAQTFEQTLGWSPTDNFHVYSDKQNAYRQCFYTQEFSLTLEYLEAGKSCNTLATQGDAFEYDAEALATIKTPLLPSLARAPLPRFLNVVFHEDFHEQVRGMPNRDFDESATTLMGLLAARDFARIHYGENSAVALTLAADVEAQLASSRALITYHARLQQLYASVAEGRVSTAIARTEKARLYAEMKETCKDIAMVTINPCSRIGNNARLSFQFAYARYYPMFYDLYVTCGKDTKRTGQLIIRHADEGVIESIFVLRINDDIANRCAP